jgi:hypothetical protein
MRGIVTIVMVTRRRRGRLKVGVLSLAWYHIWDEGLSRNCGNRSWATNLVTAQTFPTTLNWAIILTILTTMGSLITGMTI